MMQKKVKRKTTFLIRIIKNHHGFTLIELLVSMILLLILILIAYLVYTNYIEKAKITVAESTLRQVRDHLNLYSIDNNKFPYSIDFSNNCVDENARAVFSKAFCDQLKEDLYTVSYNYTADDQKYIVTAQVKDSKHTVMTMTPDKGTK